MQGPPSSPQGHGPSRDAADRYGARLGVLRSAGLASKRWAAASSTFGLEGACRREGGAAGHGRRPAAARRVTWDNVGVAEHHPNRLERHAELVGRDLGESGLDDLAVRHLRR